MSLKNKAKIIREFLRYRGSIKSATKESAKAQRWTNAQIEVLAQAIQNHFFETQTNFANPQGVTNWRQSRKEALEAHLSKDGKHPYLPERAIGQIENEFNPQLLFPFLQTVIKDAINQNPPIDNSQPRINLDENSNVDIVIEVDPAYQVVVDRIISTVLGQPIAPELLVCYRQLIDLYDFQKEFTRLHDQALMHYKLACLPDNGINASAMKTNTFYVSIEDNKLKYSVKKSTGKKNNYEIFDGSIETNELKEIIKPCSLSEFMNGLTIESLEPYFPKILALAGKRGHVETSKKYKHGHLTLGKKNSKHSKKNCVNQLLNKFDAKYHVLINHSVCMLSEQPISVDANDANAEPKGQLSKNKIHLRTNADGSLDYYVISNNPDHPERTPIIRNKITIAELPELRTLRIKVTGTSFLNDAPIDIVTKERKLEANILYLQQNEQEKDYYDFCFITDYGKCYLGQCLKEDLPTDAQLSDYLKYKILESRISSIVCDHSTQPDGTDEEIATIVPIAAFNKKPAPNPRVGMIIETFANAGSRAISVSNTIDQLKRFNWGNILGGSDSLPRPESSSLTNTQSIFTSIFSGFLFLMYPVEWIYNWYAYGLKPDWLDWWQQRKNAKGPYFPWGTIKDTLLGLIYLVLNITSLAASIANVAFAFVGLGIFDSAVDLTLYWIERYRVSRDIAENKRTLYQLEARLRRSSADRTREMTEICTLLETEFSKPEADRNPDTIDYLLKAANYIETDHHRECMEYKAALVEYHQLKIRAYRSTSIFAMFRQTARTILAIVGIVGAILSFTPAAPVGFLMVAIAGFCSLLVFCGHAYHRFWMAGNITELRNKFIDKEHDVDIALSKVKNTAEITKRISEINFQPAKNDIVDNSVPNTYSRRDNRSPQSDDIEMDAMSNSTDSEHIARLFTHPPVQVESKGTVFDMQDYGLTTSN